MLPLNLMVGPDLVILLAIVGLVFVLPIVALVRLARTPASNLTLSQLAWVLVIICLPMIGSIAFLAAGERR